MSACPRTRAHAVLGEPKFFKARQTLQHRGKCSTGMPTQRKEQHARKQFQAFCCRAAKHEACTSIGLTAHAFHKLVSGGQPEMKSCSSFGRGARAESIVPAEERRLLLCCLPRPAAHSLGIPSASSMLNERKDHESWQQLPESHSREGSGAKGAKQLQVTLRRQTQKRLPSTLSHLLHERWQQKG